MIKVVSFDIGGTLLINKESSNEDKYNLKNLSLLVNLSYDNVRNIYKEVFQKQKGDFKTLILNFCAKLNIGLDDKIENFFIEKFNSSEKSTIDKDALKVISLLKEYGYKVILFSNSNCLLNNTLDDNVMKLIDGVFYSFDLGFTKTDEESYKIVEEKLGYKPNEFLHIGDTISSDYYSPLQNGWNAVFYGNSFDTNVKTIKKLTDILEYLEYFNIENSKKK